MDQSGMSKVRSAESNEAEQRSGPQLPDGERYSLVYQPKGVREGRMAESLRITGKFFEQEFERDETVQRLRLLHVAFSFRALNESGPTAATIISSDFN
jgi:hypothetical protein